MSKKLVSADELHQKWLKDPKYRQAYDSLDEEFRLASALIAARTRAGVPSSSTTAAPISAPTAAARGRLARTSRR